MIMLTGWVAFLLAWVSTVLFYKTHPSGVESGTSQKLFLYVFGKKKYLCGYKGEKLETMQSNNLDIIRTLQHNRQGEKG